MRSTIETNHPQVEEPQIEKLSTAHFILQEIQSVIEKYPEDEDLKFFYENLVNGCIRYLEACVELEQANEDMITARRYGDSGSYEASIRIEKDRIRSIAHDAAIDDFNIFNRYLDKKKESINWSAEGNEGREWLGTIFREIAGEKLKEFQESNP